MNNFSARVAVSFPLNEPTAIPQSRRRQLRSLNSVLVNPVDSRIKPLSIPPSTDQSPPMSPIHDRISASNVHPQSQSPLFGVLFPELRNIIFHHALRVNEFGHLYGQYAYYGSGSEYAGKIDTNLPLTCRLIYLETHLAPVALNEHVFWHHSNRARPGTSRTKHDAYFARMTLQQRAAVQRVHFFTHMPWLEDRRAQEWLPGLGGFSVTITIRHSCWSVRDQGNSLRLNPQTAWGEWIGSMPRIQQLVLEFETFDEEKEQLEERVRVAKRWKFPLKEGGTLVHDRCVPVESLWMKSSRTSRRWAMSHTQGHAIVSMFRFIRQNKPVNVGHN